MKLVIVAFLALAFFFLVRRKFLQIDLSLPWFLALVVLAFASISEDFIDWTARFLGFAEGPFAIVLITIFLLLGLSTFLAITMSRLRIRQIMIVRHIAEAQLSDQENRVLTIDAPANSKN